MRRVAIGVLLLASAQLADAQPGVPRSKGVAKSTDWAAGYLYYYEIGPKGTPSTTPKLAALALRGDVYVDGRVSHLEKVMPGYLVTIEFNASSLQAERIWASSPEWAAGAKEREAQAARIAAAREQGDSTLRGATTKYSPSPRGTWSVTEQGKYQADGRGGMIPGSFVPHPAARPAVGEPVSGGGRGSNTPAALPQPQLKYPLPRTISEDEVWILAQRACPRDTPQYSIGMLGAVKSSGWVWLVLQLYGEQVSPEDFTCLVCYCNAKQFGKGGRMERHAVAYDIPFGRWMDDAGVRRSVSNISKTALEMCNDHLPEVAPIRAMPKDDQLAIIDEYLSENKDLGVVSHPELLRELSRLRSKGATDMNKPLRPTAAIERSKQQSAPRTGDRVCNTGFLQLWTGTVVASDESRCQVRIDYVNNIPFRKVQYREGQTYDIAANELCFLTHVSLDNVMSQFRNR